MEVVTWNSAWTFGTFGNGRIRKAEFMRSGRRSVQVFIDKGGCFPFQIKEIQILLGTRGANVK